MWLETHTMSLHPGTWILWLTKENEKTGQQRGRGHSREPQVQKLSGPLIPLAQAGAFVSTWEWGKDGGCRRGQTMSVILTPATMQRLVARRKNYCAAGRHRNVHPSCVCPPFSIGGIWAEWQDHHSTVRGNKWLWATLDLFGDCGGQGMGSNTCLYLQRVAFLALASKLMCVGSRFFKFSTNQA